jgi:hypothetical protein
MIHGMHVFVVNFKLGALPLPDNEARDKYIYELLVQTGDRNSAETDSKVSVSCAISHLRIKLIGTSCGMVNKGRIGLRISLA